MATVTLQNVRKSFDRTEVIHGVDLEIADGEFVVFVGPSGCGKSTLLRLIAGLEDVTSGAIRIGERDVTDVEPAKRGVSMVFQSYALYPHMTVYRNIAFGLTLAKTARETVDQRVRAVADMLQIGDLLERRPRELSGGQRQRVAIARALVREPEVFLFDEPLSNLDAALRAQTRVELARMHEEISKTMIFVTHDQVEAMTLADRLVVLNAGRVEQVGPPTELYHRPRSRFVAGFLGSPQMNFLPAEIAGSEARLADGVRLTIRQPGLSGAATLGIRPEDLELADEGPMAGKVALVEELGEARSIHVALGDGTMVVLRDRSASPPRRGASVRLRPAAEKWHVFDREGLRVVRD